MQIPEQISGGAQLVVINPKGATLVVARNDLVSVRGRALRVASQAPAPSGKKGARVQTSANPIAQVGDKALVNDAGLRSTILSNGGAASCTPEEAACTS